MWEWLSFLNTHTYTHLPRLRFSPAWTFFSWQWPVAAWEGKGCQSCISEVLEGPHQVRSGTGSPAQVETKELLFTEALSPPDLDCEAKWEE